MTKSRPIHPDFLFQLEFKDKKLAELFKDLRNYILEIHPGSNELLYQTYALTTVFSVSEKLSDAFCMINIYTNHLNLGFNKGTLINDPYKLLTGTGNLIRHIPVDSPTVYRNKKIKDLVKSSVDFAINDMAAPVKSIAKTISKIKTQK